MSHSISIVIIILTLLNYSVAEKIHVEKFDAEKDITISISPTVVEINKTKQFNVTIKVPDGYHITSLENQFFFVQIKDTKHLSFQKSIYPKPVLYEGEEVFQKNVVVTVPFTILETPQTDSEKLELIIGYQICAEFGAKTCFLPVERNETRQFKFVSNLQNKAESVSPPNAQVDTTNTPMIPSIPSDTMLPDKIEDDVQQQNNLNQNQSLEERFSNALSQGSIFAFFLVFLGGILASLTPCVYPIIPITMGYIGSRSGGSKMRGFTLSLAFVLGLAIVYSALGLFAASTGALFGAFTQTPWFLGSVGILIGIMGISMLGVFDIPVPGFASEAQANPKGGYFGATVMGGLSGLVAAPCVGPILVALLAWVAQSGSLVLGFFLLFTFSIGMGLLFIAIGTFSGLLQSLPSAGEWMVSIKKAFGVVMLAGALFLMRPILASYLYELGWAILLAFSAILLWGKSLALEDELTLGFAFKRAISILLMALSILFLTSVFPIGMAKKVTVENAIGVSSAQNKSEMLWKVNQEEQVLLTAKSENKRILIDFYADWCAACVELDNYTWVDGSVQKAVQNYELLKFDFTKQNNTTNELMKKYKIQGLPTVLVLSPEGKELNRFTGFKSAKEFLVWLDSIG